MRLRSDRDRLLEVFGTAARAAGARGAVTAPVLRLVLLGERLTVTGSDPDLLIEVEAPVVGEQDGSALLPARLGVDIVRSFGPGAVEVVASEEEVRISSGKAEFAVRSPVDRELPRVAGVDSEAVKLPAAMFAEGVRQVVRAALIDDTRAPQLTGVLLVAVPHGLRLVALDSYRLAVRDLAGVSLLDPGTEVLVPARSLAEVQRVIGTTPEGASDDLPVTKLDFYRGEFDAVFSVGSVKIVTRLLTGRFPDYQKLIPTDYLCGATIDRPRFAEALRRVRLLVRDSRDATTPVRVSFNGDHVVLSVVTQESGHAQEEIEAVCTGDQTVVAFNPNYLLDGVEALHSEHLVIEAIDASKPAQVRSNEDEDYRYLLMPVRIT